MARTLVGEREMDSQEKLVRLREVITENLRVQRDGQPIGYINVGTALQDACSKQNHAIFARRGCGKTLLLHDSSRVLATGVKSIYLNCEDFKRHTFPNVLIEILSSLFRELDQNLQGWFGRKRKSKEIIRKIIDNLAKLQRESDSHDEHVKRKNASEIEGGSEVSGGFSANGLSVKVGSKSRAQEKEEVERSFRVHKEKLGELDRWLPELKEYVREFFKISNSTSAIILQIDDLYHLKRTDQAFVVDYIHRLCKDVPLYFKIATLRHASTLYLDRDGQPIGAQERHDYQPINIDYNFSDFMRTSNQNRQILEQFGKKAGLTSGEIGELFRGEGFDRLVMAGGGVPRDVLSLFLEVLSDPALNDNKIGKDDVRILSKRNFERKIEELKQDSKNDEQDDLLKGIYIIRQFCLERSTNVFVVQEKMLQQNNVWRALFYRLLDYRIIHNCATALTHKSKEGTFQAFAIDIGCYAHLRKLKNKFSEIDISSADAKEKIRSSPILEEHILSSLFKNVPQNIEEVLLEVDENI
jgi:hypothetical protein